MFNKNFSYNGVFFSSKEDFFDKIEILENKFTENHHKDNLNFLKDFLSEEDFILTRTSGSTGQQKEIIIKKIYFENSAIKTGKYFALNEKSKVAICLPSKYIAGKMMLVRSVILGLDLIVLEPNDNPLKYLAQNIDFIAMTPMQFLKSKEYHNKVKKILLGGEIISKSLENEIKKMQNTQVFHSYGMTETVSHIAIRDIKNDDFFSVLDNVKIYIDENNCLEIEAKDISENRIKTKDIVEIIDNNKFRFLGRFDNMINSGGIKFFSEEIESKLENILHHKFFVIGKKDEILNQKLVLFIEGSKFGLNDLENFLNNNLEKYKIPKQIVFMKEFSYTETGKINRKKTLENFEKNS